MVAKTEERERLFRELVDNVRLTDADMGVLREIRERVGERLDVTAETIERALGDVPGVIAVFSADEQAVDVRGWLLRLLRGDFDQAYFEQRALLIRRFVQSEDDQRNLFTAMSRVRLALHGAVHWALHDAGWSADPSDERTRLHDVIDRVSDLELGIILATSRERYANLIQRAERLATIGQVAASIGHDLRNPLAVMQTSVHMLKRRISDDARAERHLKRISEQITLCTVIISDLLELARNRAPDRVPTFMPDLAREAARSVPRARGVTVHVDIDDTLEPIAVDSGQVRQLVVNLVLNAVQAVGAEGEVWLHLREDDAGTGVVITIEDDGPGLPEETRRRLFEPMFTTRVGGTGLGLVLCRKVVEAHHGRISAENRPEGGARFVVSLPRDVPDDDDDSVSEALS